MSKEKTNGNGHNKPIEKWRFGELFKIFGTRRLESHPLLAEWLGATANLTDFEKKIARTTAPQTPARGGRLARGGAEVHFYRARARSGGVSPPGVLYYVHGQDVGCRNQGIGRHGLHIERQNGLGRGRRNPRPEEPFFFVHEYKPQSGTKNDPLGQLLAAQAKNPEGSPLYGLYIIGRQWFFVAMQGKEYALSRAYDATTDDLFAIASILKTRKAAIEAMFP